MDKETFADALLEAATKGIVNNVVVGRAIANKLAIDREFMASVLELIDRKYLANAVANRILEVHESKRGTLMGNAQYVSMMSEAKKIVGKRIADRMEAEIAEQLRVA